VRDGVSIPIVADEDCLVASDLPPLYGCIDGVNVKLAKPEAFAARWQPSTPLARWG